MIGMTANQLQMPGRDSNERATVYIIQMNPCCLPVL